MRCDDGLSGFFFGEFVELLIISVGGCDRNCEISLNRYIYALLTTTKTVVGGWGGGVSIIQTNENVSCELAMSSRIYGCSARSAHDDMKFTHKLCVVCGCWWWWASSMSWRVIFCILMLLVAYRLCEAHRNGIYCRWDNKMPLASACGEYIYIYSVSEGILGVLYSQIVRQSDLYISLDKAYTGKHTYMFSFNRNKMRIWGNSQTVSYTFRYSMIFDQRVLYT